MAWNGCKHALQHKIRAAGLAACWALLPGAAPAFDGHTVGIHVGDALIDALHDFQAHGTRLIFSTQVVGRDMRVLAPLSGAGIETQLLSLLSPHRLALKPIESGGWIVVPQARSVPGRRAAEADSAAGERTVPAERLNEIVVQTSRYGLERTSIEAAIDLDRSTLNSMPDTDEDVARSLQQLPGAASGGLSARTHVRGGRDDETTFRYDGVELLDPFHLKNFQGLFSAIDPAVSDSVSYWTGAFPIEFGGSIGAIVDVTPRRPRTLAAEAGVSLLNSSLLVATPFADDRGSILASGRVSNLSNVIHLLDRDIGEPEFRDFTARATWTLDDRTEVIAGVLGLSDSISLFTEDPAQRANAAYRDRYGWFKMRNEWTTALRSETLVTLANFDASREARVTRQNINNGFLKQLSDSSINALRQEFSWSATRNVNLRLGGEFSHSVGHDALQSDAVFEAPFVPGIQPEARVSRGSDVHTRYSTISMYGAARWRFAARSIVEIGVRRDGQNFQDENERSQWNARVSIRHDFTDNTTMRVAWGQFSQPEAVGHLDIADGVSDLANVRRLTQANLSVEHTFDNNVGVRAELYDKHESSAKLTYENTFSLLVLTPEIEVDRLAVRSTGARMRGIELSLQTDRQRPVSAWGTYAYSTAFDRIAGVDVPRSWSQPHSVQAGVLWKHGPWEFAGVVNWHSGWPFTPLLSSASTWQDPRDVTLALGARNSARHAGFQTVDLRVSWIKALRHGSLEASFELKNALNSDNACCRSYQVAMAPNGDATLVENTRTWLRLVPLAGIRWRL